MPGLGQVNLRLRHIATIGGRLTDLEGQVEFAPQHQQPRLGLPEPCLPGGIGGDVGAVVVEQIALDVRLPGLAEKRELIGPQVRIVAFDGRITAEVARARGGQRQQIRAQRALVGCPVLPERAA